MKRRAPFGIGSIPLFLVGGMLLAGPGVAAAQRRDGAAAGVPAYHVRVRVDVASGGLDATAEIGHAGRTTFRLSRDLTVRRVLADGAPARFSESAPAADGLRVVTVDAAAPARLVVEYGGRLAAGTYPPLVSQVNGVVPGRVELASYVGWYPQLEGYPGFTFDLLADLPAGYVTVTNGKVVGKPREAGGRIQTQWRSPGAVGDILLLAAPGLRQTVRSSGGTTVELYASALPADYLETMSRDVAATVSLLTRLLGSPPPTDVVRVAYAPRPGWGYVRTPLIVVSEQSALAGRRHRFGTARDLRYIAHEVAHYWWHQADAGTPEDWINEGLAEYSALLAVEQLVGTEFRDTLLGEYRERSATTVSSTAIVETRGDSPDREINRYTRPVLMLHAARERDGAARDEALLRALYERFAHGGPATTTAFLEAAGQTLGPAARDTFSAALHRKDWGTAPAYVLAPGDSAFLGTWRGSLTQAGATNTVVLHLTTRDSVLVAALDSPDQGVQGIPVPVVRIARDTLIFSLGNVGVSYRGALSADHASLAGEWTQGGATIPFKLTRQDR